LWVGKFNPGEFFEVSDCWEAKERMDQEVSMVLEELYNIVQCGNGQWKSVTYQTAPNVKHYYVYFEVYGGHISTRVDLFAQMESRITCPKYTSQTTQTTSQ